MPQSAYTVADQQRMTRATNYFDWQAKLVLPETGQRVLEIGCGIGNFTGRLIDRELVVAIDSEPDCIEQLRARYPSQRNLFAMSRDAARPLDDLERDRLDSCVCLNVLEHIEDDEAALQNVAAILAPGGAIILILPAFQCLYGPIDRHLGHFRRYTRASLRDLAKATGLTVKHTRYMNLPGFFAWWLNAKILKLEAQSEAQIELFDRYFVPVISRAEAAIHPPFGQSIFAVLEKPR